MAASSQSLDFYGTIVNVESDLPHILDQLRFDFSQFLATGDRTPAVRVRFEHGKMPMEKIPQIPATTHAPQYVSFDWDNYRYVNYYGAAQVLFNYSTEEADFYSLDDELGYERLYLLILSRVGEMLDRRGLHRIHALSFVYNGWGVIVLLPMHGGKSTLAMQLLKIDGIRLVSEDTPLLNLKGQVVPFPVRFGIMPGEQPTDIPASYQRSFQRQQYGPKVLIDAACFAGRIERSHVPVGMIVAARWLTHGEAKTRGASWFFIFKALLRDCVVGLGLPQVVEFFLRSTWRDLFSKSALAARRTLACLSTMRSAKRFELLLSDNRANNAALLLELVKRELGSSQL